MRLLSTFVVLLLAACASRPEPRVILMHAPAAVPEAAPAAAPTPRPGDESPRLGDEIIVCGRLFHTGAPVVLWMDPGGYDASRPWRRFTPAETRPIDPAPGCDTPQRYGVRPLEALGEADRERVRDHGWDLAALAQVVDKFVIHYDVCGTSRQCFRVLHDVRGLSVHFLLDVDGTIYQTLDLRERARHAGAANDSSVGVEIAQIGAYDPDDPKERAVLDAWYKKDESGRVRVSLPRHLGDPHLRTAGFVPRPARDAPILGEIHGRRLMQYDFTEEQYASLAKLTAALCTVFPRIRLEAPRGPNGAIRTSVLDPAEAAAFGGLIGHWHVTEAKIDPGPAFDWDRVIEDARAAMAPATAP